MRFLKALFAGMVAVVMAGCAAPMMPLSASSDQVDAAKPLYLVSVTVKNDYKERYQPVVLNVVLEKDIAGKPEREVFRMDGTGTIEAAKEGDPAKYLVRFNTDGTEQMLRGNAALARAFPIVGFFYVPIYAPLKAAGPGVYYLGAVQATVRERKDNEFRAGPVIPLIDQAVAGASGGTFDVVISDAYDVDVEAFRKAFPALKGVEIRKAIMPPWDRAKVQKSWETE